MSINRKPLVSVIIPTFNRAHVVYRAIDSVLQQTFSNYEIIVVDDNSADDTQEVLESRYGNKIKYIQKNINEGLSAARNTGIEASAGAYIAFLDDDDIWMPDKLVLQVEAMKKNSDIGLSYCGCIMAREDGSVVKEVRPAKRGNIFEELLYQNYIFGSGSVILIKKDILPKTGSFDVNLTACEDWDLCIRVARDYQIDFVEKLLVKYMVREDNMHNDIYRMEKNTFAVLNKYWPGLCQQNRCDDKKNKVFSDHCINFAWKYYNSGDIESFNRLLLQALENYPLNEIFIHGSNLQEKEAVLFGAFNSFWNKKENHIPRKIKKSAFRQQYLQIAWEYYRKDDMISFRRCMRKVVWFYFPAVPLRTIIAYLKSYLGKRLSDGIHRGRKKIIS